MANIFSWYVAMRSSTVSRMPACSPAFTKLQYKPSKYWGYLLKALLILEPVSISALISPNKRCKAGLAWLRADMSKDCKSGTPAFNMVDNCRVKRAISLPVILRRWENMPCFATFTTLMPCLRKA